MANRPIFIPIPNGVPCIKEINLEFKWFPGHSKVQAQKSINSLHQAAQVFGISPVLEISSKSPNSLGISLSAFNLTISTPTGQKISVECAFQGSKVFEKGGPFTDLYSSKSRDAKTDNRIRNSGRILKYIFFDEGFSAFPITFFYDWLYIKALNENKNLSENLYVYKGFTDIAFNPKKSRNCQARSAALFVALSQDKIIDQAIMIRNS